MLSILGTVVRVAIGMAVLGTASRVVLTQGVISDDAITTTRSPSYHYHYHSDARHAADEVHSPPSTELLLMRRAVRSCVPPSIQAKDYRRNDSKKSNVGGCPRDGGAADKALMKDACPDISRFDSSRLSAVRPDNETTPQSVMITLDIEQLLASPEAIAAICRPIGCLDAIIRASSCTSSTNNATIAVAEAVCGCHAVLDASCQASFRDAAVLLPISEVVASSAHQSTVTQSSHNTSSNVPVLIDTAVDNDSATAVATSVDEYDEMTSPPAGYRSVMPTSHDVGEEPMRLPCGVPFHCRLSLAAAEECTTLMPFLTHTYMSTTAPCCSSGDGDTRDSDACFANNNSDEFVRNSSISGSNSSTSSASVRRQYYDDRDAANELLAMAMPDSIMALVEVFIDPPSSTLADDYLPPFERRVEMLREASIYGVGDAVTSSMRSICEWVSRSRNAESGAEALFWDMLKEPEIITEVCREVQSNNGECLQTAIDVCFGGSTEDFIALMDAALTEELIWRDRRETAYNNNFENYDYNDEVAAPDKRRIQDLYRRGQGWTSYFTYDDDWRADAVTVVRNLLVDVITGAIPAYEEYVDYGEGMYGDVQGLLSRVVGPMCTSACDRLISSCEAVSALSSLFSLDFFLLPEQRTNMCRAAVVEAPLLSSGAKQRMVRAEATLSGLATVEDFTDALRSKFRQDMAKAAHVPLEQVRIISVKAGSVVVVSHVLIRADTDEALEAYVADLKSTLDNPVGIFESRYFGTVYWTAFGSRDDDPNDDESAGVDTTTAVFGTSAFGIVISLVVASLFFLE